MRIFKALLLPLLLILSLIGVDRLVGKPQTSKHPSPQVGCIGNGVCEFISETGR